MARWTVTLAPRVVEQLRAITDRRIQQQLQAGLKRLEVDPEKIGEPLLYELAGYYSIRAAGQRYRLIYRLEAEQVMVLVVTIGMRRSKERRDIYELARKLARLGLLEETTTEGTALEKEGEGS